MNAGGGRQSRPSNHRNNRMAGTNDSTVIDSHKCHKAITTAPYALYQRAPIAPHDDVRIGRLKLCSGVRSSGHQPNKRGRRNYGPSGILLGWPVYSWTRTSQVLIRPALLSPHRAMCRQRRRSGRHGDVAGDGDLCLSDYISDYQLRI